MELAANGILNQVSCETFEDGCPKKHYFSDEMYKCKLFEFILLKAFNEEKAKLSFYFTNDKLIFILMERSQMFDDKHKAKMF